MNCPHCGTHTRVLSTGVSGAQQGLVRRRECANEHRFTTTEVLLSESKDLQGKAQEKDAQ